MQVKKLCVSEAYGFASTAWLSVGLCTVFSLLTLLLQQKNSWVCSHVPLSTGLWLSILHLSLCIHLTNAGH